MLISAVCDVYKLKRQLLNKLVDWKKQSKRKPVLLDDARQTCKSYLLEQLFGAHFTQVIRLDFLEQPRLTKLFSDSLNPQDILSNIELEFNISIDKANALSIFDEIGKCQEAVSSLKFFSEQCPELYICASGSNIGLLGSFPIGNGRMIRMMTALTFEEFLWASKQTPLINTFEQMNMGKVAHEKLFSLLLDYC
jgi:predicted AAA+ superfamily ATPase